MTRDVLRVAVALLALGTATSCGSESSTEPDVRPVPTLVALSPNTVTAGSGDLPITVSGSGFVRASIVYLDGAAVPTTFRSSTELRATLPSFALAAAPVTRQVTVVSPSPGGGTSNGVTFTVVVNPGAIPAITSISPDSVRLDAPGTITLQIAGQRFDPRSTVSITLPGPVPKGVFPTVTFNSASSLTATFQASALGSVAGAARVTVTNPPPNLATSTAASLVIAAPMPTVSSLSHSSVVAGSATDTLMIDGAGFYAGSAVNVGRSVYQPTATTANRLTVVLNAADLATPGSYPVSVTNPAPGGGASSAIPFAVVAEPPAITGLPSLGAVAGRGGFALAVDGANFTVASVVRWNGNVRPTTFVAGTRLTADIPASDAAGPGTAQITVTTPNVAPPSNAVTFTVRSMTPASITSQLTVPVPARDLVYDPGSALLYAAVPATASTYANSVVAIDPVSGSVVNSVVVGNDPDYIIRSTDGTYLYVALRGTSSVRRVSIAGLAPGLEFSVAPGVVEEMIAVPGARQSVVVSRMNPSMSARHIGLTAYDDGVPRAIATSYFPLNNTITFSGRSANTFYGYDNEVSGFEFQTISLSASGVALANTKGGLINSYNSRIVGAGGRVYTTNGFVIDPELRTRVASLPVPTTLGPVAVAPDSVLGRVFFLANGAIYGYDLNTWQPLGALTAPGNITDHPALARLHLVRWGTDGLAYRDGTNVYILRSTLSGP